MGKYKQTGQGKKQYFVTCHTLGLKYSKRPPLGGVVDTKDHGSGYLHEEFSSLDRLKAHNSRRHLVEIAVTLPGTSLWLKATNQ